MLPLVRIFGIIVVAARPAISVAQTPAFLNINPSWSPDGRQLVFESTRSGRTALFIINADGTGERRLTNNVADDTHPGWSPDGSTIVFDSNRDGGVWNLYAIRPDGTDEKRLTHPGASRQQTFARHPTWSPDSRRIAFDSDRDGDDEVYVMNADGSGAVRLTHSPGRDTHPAWWRGPSGERIVFGSYRNGGNGDIWSMAPDGSDQRALITHAANEGGGKLSPDGRRLAFFSERSTTPSLFIANADGSDPRQVTTQGTSFEVAWSPDGQKIAFYSDRTGRFELYVMNADGSDQRQLTHSQYDNSWPVWSPNGDRILFASTRDADYEIYVMHADGRDARRLTYSPGRDAHPTWTPRGDRILFQSPRDYAVASEVDLYGMDSSGMRQRRFLVAPGFDGVIVPSPDGRTLAFQRGTRDSAGAALHWELFLVDSAGGNERQLTSNTWSSQVPSWLPDGREFVFFANRTGRDQLYIMTVDTRAVRPLITSQANDAGASVSPDGRFVVFSSDRDGTRDLYLLVRSSGSITRITTRMNAFSASWSRDGERLTFSASATGVDEIYVMRRDGSGLTRLTKGTEGLR